MAQQDQDRKYTYFITGGGTGGHVYPAINVAKRLKEEPDTEKIYFVGNPKKLEYEIALKNGFEFLAVNISGMPRKFGWKFIKWIFGVEFASWKAMYYILKYKPDAIFGAGGYVSAPCLFAAVLLKKPFMIHDSDAFPGIVSRTVAPMAAWISLAFEEAKSYLKNQNATCFGNPISSDFFTLSKQEARSTLNLKEKTTLLAMGGSQGALTINRAVIKSAKTLSEDYNLQIIIQTGIKNYEESLMLLEKEFPEYKENVVIKPYFDDMPKAMIASDIIISRAGSMSLSEIEACSLASILVPYPYAAGDHQRKNAAIMQKQGASIYIEDEEFKSNKLIKVIEELLNSPDKLEAMKQKAFELCRPDATANIVNRLKRIARKDAKNDEL